MTSDKIRQNFLRFFEKKGHTVVKSSSLIPDDPSVLLTTAGMQQFKRYYTGELNAMADFGSQRTASAQKSFRTSDIEEVGDKTHLTFFEMLGNFSFGPVGSDDPDDFGTSGYFKRSSIHWAYEFVTEILEIPKERIWVSVFEGDNEVPFDDVSYKIWHGEIGMPKEKIMMGNRADNFWGPTGSEGPCGPTSEIYVDGVEIWNLVFNEFYQTPDKKLRKLDNPGVDTGMGFERLVTVLQGAASVYETDIFRDLVAKIRELAGDLGDRVIRILADHLRASAFLIADGVRPSNKEAGYILRRLLRRILAYEVKYDIHADLFPESLEIIKNKFGGIYPEVKKIKLIYDVLEDEKQKFQTAIGRGPKEVERFTKRIMSAVKDELVRPAVNDFASSAGSYDLYPVIGEMIWRKKYAMAEIADFAFELFQTHGVPLEITIEFLKEKIELSDDGIQELRKGFEEKLIKHQEVSRAGLERKFGGHGLLLDTGELKAGSEEELNKVLRLHTATHLLQWALREVLGKEVRQMGSDINAERSRFDFALGRKMTTEEIKKVEDLINQKIKEDLMVYFEEMTKTEAEKTGALHFFGQKYPDVVKIYFIGSEASGGVISAEFCGGPHVGHTLEIGKIRVLKEEAVSAGVRRVRIALQ